MLRITWIYVRYCKVDAIKAASRTSLATWWKKEWKEGERAVIGGCRNRNVVNEKKGGMVANRVYLAVESQDENS